MNVKKMLLMVALWIGFAGSVILTGVRCGWEATGYLIIASVCAAVAAGMDDK